MQIGVRLPQTGRLADPAVVRAAAQAAESLGYGSVWVVDDPADGLNGASVLDPVATLTYAAAATSRVRLGTCVVLGSSSQPEVIARSLASLDVLSEGRLVVALPCGRPEPDVRQCVDAVLSALDGWERRPRVLLGGDGDDDLARAALRGDGWSPAGVAVDALASTWARVRRLAADAGRDPDGLALVVRADVVLHDAPAGDHRAAYEGTVEQIAADLDATRRAGADEVVLGLVGDHTLDAALDVYATLAEALETAAPI